MARALLLTRGMVPEQSGWRRLTFDTIETLPETGGVFEIGNLVRNVLYIDCADGNLRRRLTTLGPAPSTLPPCAGGYYVRFVSTAKEAEARDERLAAYREAHDGQLPVGNARPSLARLHRAA
jgi:hypothetical protein